MLKLKASIYASILILIISVTTSFAQTDGAGLVNKPIREGFNGATLRYVLSTLAVDYGVPVGLEVSALDKNSPEITIEPNKTLKEVLEAVVEQEPHYRWEVRDGVINLAPSDSRENFVNRLLNTKIQSFTCESSSDNNQLRNCVTNLAEVQKLIKENDLKTLSLVHPYSPRVNSEKVPFKVFNQDLRSILNKIALESKFNFWIVDRVGEKRDYVSIAF
jgi:hypothetical protein